MPFSCCSRVIWLSSCSLTCWNYKQTMDSALITYLRSTEKNLKFLYVLNLGIRQVVVLPDNLLTVLIKKLCSKPHLNLHLLKLLVAALCFGLHAPQFFLHGCALLSHHGLHAACLLFLYLKLLMHKRNEEYEVFHWTQWNNSSNNTNHCASLKHRPDWAVSLCLWQ